MNAIEYKPFHVMCVVFVCNIAIRVYVKSTFSLLVSRFFIIRSFTISFVLAVCIVHTARITQHTHTCYSVECSFLWNGKRQRCVILLWRSTIQAVLLFSHEKGGHIHILCECVCAARIVCAFMFRASHRNQAANG